MTAGPLLFFDSGVGALSVVDALRAQLPTARLIYAADSAAFPYGTRSEAEIAARVPALLGRLSERFRPAVITIACNTASTIALPAVRAALDLPVVGTVPAIKPAAALSRTRVIGVLGTDATVRQPYVDDLARRFASDCTVLRHGSAALVELAEAKLRGQRIALEDVLATVAPLAACGRLDTLVLACTHFPLLRGELAACLPGVTLVDGAAGIARRVLTLLEGAEPEQGAGVAVFTRLGEPQRALAPALAARGFPELIEL